MYKNPVLIIKAALRVLEGLHRVGAWVSGGSFVGSQLKKHVIAKNFDHIQPIG